MHIYYTLYYVFSLLGLLALVLLYGTVLHFLLRWITGPNWRKRYTYLIVGILFIVWKSSYWGDQGGADYDRIPLEHPLEVRHWSDDHATDAVWSGNEALIRIGKFVQVDSRLYGETREETAKPYFVLDIAARKITLLTEAEYDGEVTRRGFPDRGKFATYRSNSEKHWGNQWVALLY